MITETLVTGTLTVKIFVIVDTGAKHVIRKGVVLYKRYGVTKEEAVLDWQQLKNNNAYLRDLGRDQCEVAWTVEAVHLNDY